MAFVVRMPALAAGAAEAAVQTWLVAVGDTVQPGQTLVEIETEKAVVEYEAEQGGVVAALLVPTGDVAAVGSPIAVLATGDETTAQALASAGVDPSGAVIAPPDAAPATSRPDAAFAPAEGTEEHVRLFASPLVRRLARERGIDLASLHGSGPHGRVVRRDLDDGPVDPAVPARSRDADSPGYTDIPHTGMRRAIARRLTQSASTIPHFTVVADCRVDELLQLRARLAARTDVSVSINDFVVKAVAVALREVPDANAIWTDEATRRFDTVDIGIAVAVPAGLVTPVLRGVEQLSLGQVAGSTRELVERARAGRLKQAELEGGSFAVSNLGMYAVKEFAAIINPPHAGILAVGAATQRPVVDTKGRVVAASVMTVTLSADHRVLDGALAAQWLAAFTARIENPLSLLIS